MRRRFAAPFVLVIGCSGGGSPDHATAPPSPPRDAAPLPVATADASPPPDTATAIDAAIALDPCGLPPAPGNPTCNPPAPRTLEARVIDSRREGADLLIVVNKGAGANIGPGWRGVLLGDNGRPVAGASLELVKVERSATTFRLKQTSSLPGQRVQLSPP